MDILISSEHKFLENGTLSGPGVQPRKAQDTAPSGFDGIADSVHGVDLTVEYPLMKLLGPCLHT